MKLLEGQGLRKAFGGLQALAGVSFDIEEGEIRAIIGPNGAGKTTLFNLISGLLSPDAGELRFRGRRLNGLRPFEVAALGIGRTFQNLQIFGNMTVLENVMVGRHAKTRAGFVAAALRLPRARGEEREVQARALHYLELVGLADRATEPAWALTFGHQRLLELARALATEPRLLLLDEPMAGLSAAEADGLAALIFSLRAAGLSLCLVEHHMGLVMRVSDRILVLNYGEPIADGPPSAVQRDSAVIVAYLGEELEGA